jgi:hypothetical protein
MGYWRLLSACAIFVVFSVAAGAAVASTIQIYSDGPQGEPRASLTCDGCSVLIFTANGADIGGVDGAYNRQATIGNGSYGYSQVDGTLTSFGELFSNSVSKSGKSKTSKRSNPASEANWFNSIMGMSVSLTDVNKTENTLDKDPFGGRSSADYIIAKVGRDPSYTIIRNDNVGGSFAFSWQNISGGGLSHYTEVNLIPTPIPASGMFLLTAFGGIVLMARRRRRAP